MTDKEIIKALEVLQSNYSNMGCSICKTFLYGMCAKANNCHSGISIVLKDAIDFIKRQQAEIDRLRDSAMNAKGWSYCPYCGEKLKGGEGDG